MYLAVLAFLVGVMTLNWFSVIPSLWWFLPVFIIVTLLWHFSRPHYRFIFELFFIALLSCFLVMWKSGKILQWQLPENLETKTVTVIGTIDSLPNIADDVAQFEFFLEYINGTPQHARIQLSWYQYDDVPLKVGDQWQMQVRLKRAHGLLNPGGFDYEKWLFYKGIRATGYITNPEQAKFLQTKSWGYLIDRFRQYLQQKIRRSLENQPTIGLITALIMGDQNRITENQWQVMRATGTNHLMAIAGVHIAFVSGFIYTLINFFWRKSSFLVFKLPAQQAAAFGALITAIIYSALAGFSLPAERALIMLSVFMLGLFLRRELHVWNAFALALLLILLWDPLSILSISFWLSFGAVFAIIYGISGRLKPKGLWWKYGRVQWVITIALIPISLALFQQSSIISFIANFVAVPAVGILVLPLCLIGTLFIFIFQPSGDFILWLAAKMIAGVWLILTWLGDAQIALWQQVMPNSWVLVCAMIGVLLLIAPRGFPARWLGFLWFSPLIFFHPATLDANTVRFSLLDVGQGLSAVVQTQHHVLIFDAGPPMGQNADAGSRVILPFLQTMGIKKIDTLIVSHGDSDHIGGVFSLLQQIPIKNILTSVPERFPSSIVKNYCQAGQIWQWDGIIFKIIYPSDELLHQGNNSSCVLRIETPQGAILLTGDIEKFAEDYLVNHVRSFLPAKILVAPHHGSRTSSDNAFIQAVHPQYVLFPTGYKNRYHFPNRFITARYEQEKIMMFNTAKTGSVIVEMGKEKINITLQRKLEKNIWHE